MRLILLCFVLFKSALPNEESNEKYIDLLPEEEKRQFLEKIARRILEDYHNTKTPNSSNVDMSESDLDAHTAYVQGLLQEETKLLRNERHNESHRREAKDDKIKDDRNERKASTEREDSFTDLTLRNGKREKRRNISQDPSAREPDVIPVVPLYDTKPEDQINVRNKSTAKIESKKAEILKHQSSIKDEKLNTSNSSDSRKLFVYDDVSEDNYERNGDKIEETKPQNDDKIDNDKVKSDETIIEGNKQDNEEHIKSTVIDNFEPSTNEETEDSSKEGSVEVTTDALNLATIVRSKDVNIDEGDLIRNKNGQDKFKADVKSSSLELSNGKEVKTIVTITSKPENLNTATEKERDLDETTNKSSRGLRLIDIESDNNTQQLSTKSIAKILTTRSVSTNETEIPTVTTISLNHSSDSTPQSYEKRIHLLVNNTKLDILERKEKPRNITTEHLEKEIKRLNSNDLNVFDATKRPAHETVKSDDQDDRIYEAPAKKIDAGYYVYEISADKPPFRSVNDKEEPHYAPLYNYDPKFAYYNPANRYGPNIDDLTDKDSVKEKLKDKRRNRFRNPYSILNDPYKFNMLNILKHQNHYNLINSKHVVNNAQNVNPNDYIDMDYFFGRNEDPDLRRDKKKIRQKVFPDSNENEHPYQTIQQSLEGHLRAVRKLLYAHKHFGYIPPRPKITQDDETLRSKDITVFDHNDKHKNDITLDYYFGRQNSREVNSDKLFQINLSELKDLFTATPNPINGANEKLVVSEKNKRDDIEPFVKVIKDMVQMDNEALVQYDWLGSTVDIQSALHKLKDLTNRLKNTLHIHPSDLELFKYIVYLYKSTKQVNETELSIGLLKNTINKLRKRIKKKSLMPKIKKKPKKFASAIKMWKDFRTFLRTLIQYDKIELLRQFESFLAETQFNLNDFHGAIRNIATVTKYENQNWFGDLKNIYFKRADKRMLLEVILHLSLSRLLGLIEESSTNGLEDSFTEYVKKNKEEVDATKEEFKLVLLLLKEFKGLN